VRRTEATSPLTWLGGIIVLYLGLPLAAFAVRFVTSPERGFHSPGLFPALWVSVICATISLGVITVLGLPLAYYLAHSSSKLSSFVLMIVQIPLALPPVMAGIVLIYVVGPYTFLGQLFGQRLTESMAGIVIAMTFCAAPFLIVSARAGFVSVDRGLLDVAATLGHGDAARFLRVSVPLAGPSIRAGMLLTWLRAFGEYGAVVILAYNPASLPIYTYNQFSGVGLPTTMAPTALALCVAALAVMASRIRPPRRRRPRAAGAAAVAPGPNVAHPVTFELAHRLGDFELDVTHCSSARHLAVLGASGSGKSALLRCLAGLYGPAPGPVWYGSELVRDVPVQERQVGYVAQGFSLFPHLTVWEHLMFPKGATAELAAYWLARLRLEGLEARFPSELSGGQRQRVGLAQVLSRSPRVLLLDEPFSALDMPVRKELRRELRRLQHETDLATVLVTHDPDEAAFLSEEVIVISEGRALQSGSTRDVFVRPASASVASLLGIANLYEATVVAPGEMDTFGTTVRMGAGEIPPGSKVQWSIRPEHVDLWPSGAAPPRTSDPRHVLAGAVSDVADYGAVVETIVRVSEHLSIEVRSLGVPDVRVGDPCEVHLRPDAIAVWPVADTVLADRAASAAPRP